MNRKKSELNPYMVGEKTPEMEEFIENLGLAQFGRSRNLAIAGQGCVMCGKSAIEFRNEKSKREWQISAMCQLCQDKIFGED